MDPIYLDHNATTPLLPEVLDAMLPYLREHFGNPSSSHVYGARARAALETARAQVAELTGASPTEIIFTSGGTEASNWVLREPRSGRGAVALSRVEHPATAAACLAWWDEVRWLPVDEVGEVRLGEAAELLDERVGLLSVMHANNELGTIEPVEALARLARAQGIAVHVDVAQSLGKVPVDVSGWGVEYATIVGHKLYAPKGVGALYVRDGAALTPRMLGGGQESGRRAGTQNVASIVGLGEACRVAQETLEEEGERQWGLRERLRQMLAAQVPGLVVNGPEVGVLPNTLHVSFPGVMGADVLARAGRVAASTGAACHEGETTMSATLEAIGCTPERARGAVRLSLGRGTKVEDVEEAARALAAAWKEVR